MVSTQLRTALAFLDTFKDLDYKANVALRTADCRHSFAPASLGIAAKTNEQFAAHVQGLQKNVEGIPVTPKQIFEGTNSITVWATSDTKFKTAKPESVNWKYEGEYIFVLEFNEARDRIRSILEFLDSKKVEAVWKLL